MLVGWNKLASPTTNLLDDLPRLNRCTDLLELLPRELGQEQDTELSVFDVHRK